MTVAALEDRRTVAVAAAVALVPFVVAAVEVLRAGDVAVHADAAVIEVKVRDVGTSDTPLLGSYQRFGWNMPGPLLFYVLAVPYRLLGSGFSGLQVGALLIGAAALVGVVMTVHRCFGVVPAVLSAALLAVLARSLGDGLSEPWEPKVIVLPVVLLVVLTAAAAAGRTAALPVLAVVATFLVQAYTTVAPVAAAVVGFGVAGLAWRHHRARRSGDALDEPLWRPAITSGILLVLLWLPPLLHELSGRASNLARMWRFARTGDGSLGLAEAASATALELDHRAFWVTGRIPTGYGTAIVDTGARAIVPLALVALLAGVATAWRRRDRAGLVLGATVLVALLAAVVALSRVTGGLYVWILYWTGALGVSAWLAAGISARGFVDRGPARVRRAVTAVLAVGVAVASVGTALDAADRDVPPRRDRDAVAALAPAAVAAARDVDGPVVVRSTVAEGALLGGTEIGAEYLVLALERAGIRTQVSPSLAHKLGDHRRVDGTAVAEVRLVSDDGSAVPPGFRLLGRANPLDDTNRRAVAEQLAVLGFAGASVDEIPAEHEAARVLARALEDLDARAPIALLFRVRP
jgi:hypothetical protein